MERAGKSRKRDCARAIGEMSVANGGAWRSREISRWRPVTAHTDWRGFSKKALGWRAQAGWTQRARVSKAHPARRRFYTEVAQWAAERAWLRLAFLRLDERALAFDYCLEFNRTHYLLKTGYDRVYERFSPGKVLRHLERLAVQMTHWASWGHERLLRRSAQEEDSPSPQSRDGQERGCPFLRR
jgi:hypothetical protein